MADSEHLAILKPGMEVWNRWRQDFPELTQDLQGRQLPGTLPVVVEAFEGH
jgi:hypothetical protein